jgi:Flp pilus assembly protein TadB
MTYLLLFLAVTLAALGVLAVMPARPKAGVRTRLDRLETVGGALVPVEDARKRPRKAKARKRRRHVPRALRLAFMATLLLLPAWFAWGPLQAVVAVAGFVLALGCGDWLWKGWSMRMVRRQLPAAVRIMSERLRTTNSFFAALEAVEKSGMQPVASQFGKVRQDVARGLPEEQALERFAARIPILETEILAKAIAYHPQKGQRLASALDGIAELLDGRRRLIGVLDGAWGGG